MSSRIIFTNKRNYLLQDIYQKPEEPIRHQPTLKTRFSLSNIKEIHRYSNTMNILKSRQQFGSNKHLAAVFDQTRYQVDQKQSSIAFPSVNYTKYLYKRQNELLSNQGICTSLDKRIFQSKTRQDLQSMKKTLHQFRKTTSALKNKNLPRSVSHILKTKKLIKNTMSKDVLSFQQNSKIGGHIFMDQSEFNSNQYPRILNIETKLRRINDRFYKEQKQNDKRTITNYKVHLKNESEKQMKMDIKMENVPKVKHLDKIELYNQTERDRKQKRRKSYFRKLTRNKYKNQYWSKLKSTAYGNQKSLFQKKSPLTTNRMYNLYNSQQKGSQTARR